MGFFNSSSTAMNEVDKILEKHEEKARMMEKVMANEVFTAPYIGYIVANINNFGSSKSPYSEGYFKLHKNILEAVEDQQTNIVKNNSYNAIVEVVSSGDIKHDNEIILTKNFDILQVLPICYNCNSAPLYPNEIKRFTTSSFKLFFLCSECDEESKISNIDNLLDNFSESKRNIEKAKWCKSLKEFTPTTITANYNRTNNIVQKTNAFNVSDIKIGEVNDFSKYDDTFVEDILGNDPKMKTLYNEMISQKA